MKSRLHQVAFAIFFTLLGMAVAIMGVVALDNKTKPQKASNTPVNTTASDCTNTSNTTTVVAATSTETQPIKVAKPTTQARPQKKNVSTAASENVMQLRKGPALVVHDIMDANKPGIEFVPFYNDNGQFDKVAVYRHEQGAQSTSYNKRMDMMYPLPKASTQFPPISEAEAQRKAQSYKPNSYPQYQGKLVTFASVDIPYYYFKLPNSNNTLLVDAFTGMAQIVSAKELEDERKFQQMQGEGMGDVMKVNANGKFYTPPDVLKKIPEKERKIIQAEQAFFNEMIEKGLLKINKDGEFIEDNMTAEHRKQFDDMMEKFLGSIGAEDIH